MYDTFEYFWQNRKYNNAGQMGLAALDKLVKENKLKTSTERKKQHRKSKVF